ncbi:MAG TPA: hypothetical protein VGM94_17820 [Galbitalea sp.]|jgi:hypothetical protein
MQPASAVFEAELVQHLGSRAHVPGAIVPDLADELMAEQSSEIDLVVRRLADGSEIIRTPADLGSPEALLTTAREDLQNMTADEFINEWKMPGV